MNDAIDLIGALVVGFILGALLVGGCMSDHYRTQAAEKGHAEFYLDTNYNKAWRWKEVK